MFEFAVRTTIGRYDLETAEGRIQAMQRRRPHRGPASATSRCGPSMPACSPGCSASRWSRSPPRWPGAGKAGKAGSRPRTRPVATPNRPRPSWSRRPTSCATRCPARTCATRSCSPNGSSAGGAPATDPPRPGRAGPARRCVVQRAGAPGRSGTPSSPPAARAGRPPPGPTPSSWRHRPRSSRSSPSWRSRRCRSPPTGRPVCRAERYAASLVTRLREVGLSRRIADALSQLRRLDSASEPDAVAQRELGQRLQTLQRELADLRDQQEG